MCKSQVFRSHEKGARLSNRTPIWRPSPSRMPPKSLPLTLKSALYAVLISIHLIIRSPEAIFTQHVAVPQKSSDIQNPKLEISMHPSQQVTPPPHLWKHQNPESNASHVHSDYGRFRGRFLFSYVITSSSSIQHYHR